MRLYGTREMKGGMVEDHTGDVRMYVDMMWKADYCRPIYGLTTLEAIDI